MAFYPLQAQNFSLSGAGSSIGDVVLNLKSFKDINGTVIAMTDIGAIGYMTLEPGNGTQEEQISFTGVTQNSDGSAQLTGVKSVLFKTPYTATSGMTITHPGSVVAILTNTSGFYTQFGILADDETITGTWMASDPLSAQQLATKAYVDNTVNGGTVSYDRVIPAATAGETVAAGNILYLKFSDGRWYKASASTTSTIYNVQLGIAQGAGTIGAAITGGVLIEGYDNNQSGLVAGTIYFIANTAGTIASSAGTNSRVIGNGGQSATKLYFNPNFSNATYITNTSFQNSSPVFAADAQASDTYVITLSPAITAYATGQRFIFTANTANTAAATLNVNGLGAKTIKKNTSVDLVTGDILAAQVVEVVYDGTNFQLVSRNNVINYSNGATTHDASVNGADTIAHGLGGTPRRVLVNAQFNYTNTQMSISNGAFDASGQSSVYSTIDTSSTGNVSNFSITKTVFLQSTGANANTAVVTVDDTNITITWTKTGTPTGSIPYQWAANL